MSYKTFRRYTLFLVGLAFLTIDTSFAYADNCSGLSDCFNTLAMALAIIAALIILVAILLLFLGGGGGLALAGGGVLAGAAGSSAAAVAAANLAAAVAAAAAAAAAAGQIMQMSGDGTPGNNQAQNKQFKDAIRQAERDMGKELNKDEIRQVHEEISKQNLGFKDIVQIVKDMFGGG